MRLWSTVVSHRITAPSFQLGNDGLGSYSHGSSSLICGRGCEVGLDEIRDQRVELLLRPALRDGGHEAVDARVVLTVCEQSSQAGLVRRGSSCPRSRGRIPPRRRGRGTSRRRPPRSAARGRTCRRPAPGSSAASHASNSAAGIASTVVYMTACWAPQSSAHWPSKTPDFVIVKSRMFVRPGIASCLPVSCGTHQLWVTSYERELRAASADRPADGA